LEFKLETWKYARNRPKYTLNSFIELMHENRDIQLYIGMHEEETKGNHGSVSSNTGGAAAFEFVKENFARKRHLILELEYDKNTKIEQCEFNIRYVMSFCKATHMAGDKIVLESEHSRRLNILPKKQKLGLSGLIKHLKTSLVNQSFQTKLNDLPEWLHLGRIPIESLEYSHNVSQYK